MVEICTSPSPASNSNFLVVTSSSSSLNFMKSVASPTTNSAAELLFANQNPAVVDVADVLPVAIYPFTEFPNISICFEKL